MSGHTPGPWRLAHGIVGVGGGFNERREFVVGPDGRDVSGTIGHATEITYGEDPTPDSYRPKFRKGEPFPHSPDARLIAASPTMYDYVAKRAKGGDGEAASILEAIHATR